MKGPCILRLFHLYSLIMFLRNTNSNDDVPTGSQSFLEERYIAVSQYWQSAEVCCQFCFLKMLLGHTCNF